MTKQLNSQYYIITRENNDNYPLLCESSESDDDYLKLIQKNRLSEETTLIFDVANPKVSQPEFVDYHSLPEPVISKTIASIIAKKSLPYIQLIPTEIRYKNILHKDYYYLHVLNEIECLNAAATDCDEDDGEYELETLVLDEKKLSKIKEKNRLLFYLKEDVSPKDCIIHESLVNEIIDTDPKGIQFISLPEWSIDCDFN